MTHLIKAMTAGAMALVLAGSAFAEGMDRSPRPQFRPDPEAVTVLVRPRTRPQGVTQAVATETPVLQIAKPATVLLLPVDPALAWAAERAAVVVAVAGPQTPRPLANPNGVQISVSSSNTRVPLPAAAAPVAPPVVLASAALLDLPRPKARPDGLATQAAVLVQPAAPTLRPAKRPKGLAAIVAPTAPVPDVAAPETEIVQAVAIVPSMTSPRPQKRPRDLAEKPAKGGFGLFKAAAVRTPPSKAAVMPKKGSVCGNPAIRGETMAPITAKVKGCGIAEPVKVSAVAGVKLSQPALMDCTTASALNEWVQNGLQPAFGKTQVVQLQVAGHYVCRSRNHKKGARISEHGKGRAIDISGFTLANGKTLSILKGWRGDYGKAIKAAHRAACGTFGTTLGPGSDGMHEDHLHFDTARYRSGPYCK